MGIQDLIAGPFYFLIILFIGINIRNNMRDKAMGNYFLKGLFFKLLGATGIFLIYYVYYGGSGDTVFYFRRAGFLDEELLNDFVIGFKLLFANPAVFDPDTYQFFTAVRAFDMSSFLIVRMAAVTNLIGFGSYLASAYMFSALSYIGIWKMFKMFNELFPNRMKILAWSFLFIPSVFFWGSGVLKDNVTLGFLGIFITSFYHLFIKRKKIIINVFLIIISTYIIGVIKSYILLALMPAIFTWLFFEFKNKIKSDAVRTAITPILLALIIPLGYGALQLMSNSFSKFSLDNAQEKAEDMQRWHTYRVEVLKGGDGASYNLGHVDFTPLGMASKFPAAVNAALFRPYLWESGNPVVLLSAVESLFFLFATLRMVMLFFQKPGVGFKFLADNSIIYFMIVFSLIFAFSVGFTSFNFGALSRYRIPLLPFYLGAVLLITENFKNYKKAL